MKAIPKTAIPMTADNEANPDQAADQAQGYRLHQEIHEMPPVQNRYGQQIQQSEADADDCKKLEKIHKTRFHRITRHSRDGYRPGEVFR